MVSPNAHRWLQRFSVGVALAVSAALPAAAQTSVANFNTLTDGGVGSRSVANCYTEARLVFTVVGEACGTPDSFATWGPTQSAFYSGSPALFLNSATGTAVNITGVNNLRFSLFSISLTPYLGAFGNPTTVLFTGTVLGGSTLSRSIFLPGPTTTPANFTFTGWNNLQSLRLAVTSPSFEPIVQFDNVAVDVVPEPTTVLLLGAGLLTMGAFVRRRRLS